MDRVAVVGSREGADLELVESFLQWLHEKHPDAIVVSGGAKGVDKTAETLWASMGHEVWSFRVLKLGDESFIAEKWVFGGAEPHVERLGIGQGHPVARDYYSALLYRNALIAEACTRLVAFFRPGGSTGTAITEGFASYGYGKDVDRVGWNAG